MKLSIFDFLKTLNTGFLMGNGYMMKPIII